MPKQTPANGHSLRDEMDEVVEKIERVAENVSDQLHSAKRKAQRSANDVLEKGEDVWDELTGFIDDHPGKALAVSFLAGLVVGAILLSRRRD